MNTKKVIDNYGNEVTVELESRKVYAYNNADEKVVYIAKLENEDFWTEYTDSGRVEDLEIRMQAFGSKLMETYAKLVGFNSSKNDPDKEVWKAFVEFVKENESAYFDKNGDYKKGCIITEDDIRELVRRVEGR